MYVCIRGRERRFFTVDGYIAACVVSHWRLLASFNKICSFQSLVVFIKLFFANVILNLVKWRRIDSQISQYFSGNRNTKEIAKRLET